MTTTTTTPNKKLRAVPPPAPPPEPEADPVELAQRECDRLADLTRAAGEAVTRARLIEQQTQAKFDASDATVSVMDKMQSREIRESKERIYSAHVDAEQTARVKHSQLVHERAVRSYEDACEKAEGWHGRLELVIKR